VVAFLNAADPRHAECESFIRRFRGAFLTSEAILAEAAALMTRVPGGQVRVLDFFLQGGAALVPQSPSSLRRAQELLETYASVPMDFADATLVALAEEGRLADVFTLDRRGFQVYRWARKRPFRLHPD
jgi:hypothetical protein